MVVIKLMGGLGNQMFQFACAKRIAIKNRTNLVLDTWFLERPDKSKFHTHREFELGIFQMERLKASERFAKRFYKKDIFNRMLVKFSVGKKIKEKGDYFEPQILCAPSSVYLVGFWQSEKYFEDISEIIKKDFTFPDEPENDYVASLQKKMSSYKNSVSVHIRRGDYIKNKKGLSTKFANLKVEYYQKSIHLIKSKLDDVHFFFFSDDPQYVIDNFQNVNDTTIVKHDDPVANYVDMKLMSHCKHNIIANSSYSWWGAWLNENSNKIVIAPDRWFLEGDNIRLIDERIPKSWLVT